MILTKGWGSDGVSILTHGWGPGRILGLSFVRLPTTLTAVINNTLERLCS